MSLLEQHSNAGSPDDNDQPHHHLKISLLVVVRLLPNTLFSFPGGILADTVDRKRVMVVLDTLAAAVALCYCFAVTFRSIAVLYVCTIVQEALSGLYEPNRSAILPQLVGGVEYISKANAALAIAWSLTAAVGASVGGFLTDRYGDVVCFVTDSVFYLVSAWIMAVHVSGDFSVVVREEEKENHHDATDAESKNRNDHQTAQTMTTERSSPLRMLRQMFSYLSTSAVGAYILIKGCGALLFGASDVVYATFAEDEQGLNSQRLGWMFAAVGVGCLLGPLILPDDRSHLKSCIYAYAILGIGYGLIGASPEYWQKCVWTVFRSAGTAVLWVESSILIQTTTPLQMLGRVSAIDLALALTGESVSAVMAGLLEDHGWTADQVAFLLGAGGLALSLLWAAWSKYRHGPQLLTKDSEITGDGVALEMEPLK